MRAVYLERDLAISETIVIDGEKAHHFHQVLRLKTNEKILLLDGQGGEAHAIISQISKKQVTVKIEKFELSPEGDFSIDAVISLVKRDALESILRSSCELGIRNIFLVSTEFSQSYKLNEERIKKILISGIEQSNNPFLPRVILCQKADIPYEKYENISLFLTEKSSQISSRGAKRNLIIIGPEGGFSDDEINDFLDLKNINAIKLDLPIMRAPTAFSCAVGYLLRQS